MNGSFFRAICSVGIFVICAQVLVHLRPEKSYEKYLRLLMSLMVLVQILIPVVGFFSQRVQEDFQEQVAGFSAELEKRQTDIRQTFMEQERERELFRNKAPEETAGIDCQEGEKVIQTGAIQTEAIHIKSTHIEAIQIQAIQIKGEGGDDLGR